MRPTSARYRWIIACSAPGDSGSRVLDGGGSVGSTTPSGVDRSTAMLLCNLALLSRAHCHPELALVIPSLRGISCSHPELCPRHPELCPCHPELCPFYPELCPCHPELCP